MFQMAIVAEAIVAYVGLAYFDDVFPWTETTGRVILPTPANWKMDLVNGPINNAFVGPIS